MSDDLFEWRERIGVQIMHAMKCTHKGADFGDRAVCVTCFDNTQQIGALVEAERERIVAAVEAVLEQLEADGDYNPYDAVRAALTSAAPDALARVKAEALREAAEAWRHEGRDVMFNRAGNDLTPAQRVGKWLRDRADRIARGES